MNVRNRLLTFIAYQGLTISEFERTCHLANAYVRNIRQTITPEKLANILAVYPALNVDWLLTGRGDMEHTEVPTMPRYDATILFDEYARMLECALYFNSPTKSELVNLQLSITNTIEQLKKNGQSYGHLELLYRRVLRLQSELAKKT